MVHPRYCLDGSLFQSVLLMAQAADEVMQITVIRQLDNPSVLKLGVRRQCERVVLGCLGLHYCIQLCVLRNKSPCKLTRMCSSVVS